MNAGDTAFILLCAAFCIYYDTRPCIFLWRNGTKEKRWEHDDAVCIYHGSFRDHVGTCWICTIFRWKPCRDHWRSKMVWL